MKSDYAKYTKAQLIEFFTDKEIAFDSKDSKAQLVSIAYANNRKMQTANMYEKERKSSDKDYYFNTRKNTYSADVCRAIALKFVKSTLDIRKLVCSKYSFRNTLTALYKQNFIKFTNERKTCFEMTDKALEHAAMFKARYETSDTINQITLKSATDKRLHLIKHD